MEIYKSSHRSGLSYPLKPSVLLALIEDSGIQTPVSLYQRSESWWTDGVLFRADFYPPGRYYLNEGELLHVTCRTVASADRSSAGSFLEAVILPAFRSWIQHIETLPANSTIRREKQSFTREWSPPADAAT